MLVAKRLVNVLVVLDNVVSTMLGELSSMATKVLQPLTIIIAVSAVL